MPDSGRFSDRDIERDLRDLGARIEYPPTPDLAHAVRQRLEEEDTGQQARRSGFWPPFFSPRWAAFAAAVVVVFVAALSPTIRTTLSDLFVPGGASSSGQQAGSGGSAARPESGGSGALSGQEAGEAPQAASSSAASRAQPTSGENSSESAMAESAREAACPSLSLEARPARAAPETTFRLHGDGFSTVCNKARPTQDVRIDLRQDGRIWKLATVDADRHLAFDTRLRVPAGARPGQATVRATTRSGELVEEHFVVLR